MNWEQVEGKWDQVKGDAKTKWAKLTEDDLKFVAGSRDRLVGKIFERYGVIKEQAIKDVDEWVTKVNDKLDHVGGGPKKS
jgi:uncharacterized protein YjbJ (UPF0337 family)